MDIIAAAWFTTTEEGKAQYFSGNYTRASTHQHISTQRYLILNGGMNLFVCCYRLNFKEGRIYTSWNVLACACSSIVQPKLEMDFFHLFWMIPND